MLRGGLGAWLFAPAPGGRCAGQRARTGGLAAWLFALLLGGCGQEPGEGLSPFPSDGVAGFGKAALVDVCVGSARVVPGDAAAVCVPDGAEPAACSSDLECEGAERCLCGRCFVRACGPGTVCPAGEACRGGRCTPTCTEDADCAEGEACSGGGCARPCTSDAGCLRGEVCDFFGTCAAEACGAGAACGAGYTCEPVTLSAEVREPTIAVTGEGAQIAFFELRRPSGSAVYRGRFEGPLRLVADPAEPVLEPPPGATRAGAPSALAAGERVDLLVAVDDGASIGLATSSDGGRSFAWSDASVLAPAEAWEGGAVGSPALFERDGEALFFYEGGAGAGIGLARLAGGAAERAAAGPVLAPEDLEDASFWRSVSRIGGPYALVAGGAVRVYVAARGTDGGTAVTPSGPVPPEPNDSIGMFATLDLEAFDRYPAGPVYTSLSGLFGALGEREPAVVVGERGADLYFVATGASGGEVAGLARASTVK